jgi:replicative DNA helicase
MGGIEPNIIITIGGRSGSGKSSIANSLQTDLFDLNPGDDIVMLVFNFEMLQSRNVGRTLSYKLKKTTSHLYSAVEGEAISEQTLFEAQKIAEDIKKYNIYYVDSPCNVLEMSKTIDYFQQNVAKNK